MTDHQRGGIARGRQQSAGQAERYARYCGLRDGGMRAVDAASEIGVSSSTGSAYERSYKRERGLPPGRENSRWSER